MIPEPSLNPPEHEYIPLCLSCMRPVPEMFELTASDFICRDCLSNLLSDPKITMDDLAALMCMAVVST